MGKIITSVVYPDAYRFKGLAADSTTLYYINKVPGQTGTGVEVDGWIRNNLQGYLDQAISEEGVTPLVAKLYREDRVSHWEIECRLWFTVEGTQTQVIEWVPIALALLSAVVVIIAAASAAMIFSETVLKRVKEIIWGPEGGLPFIPLALLLGGVSLAVTALAKFKTTGGG